MFKNSTNVKPSKTFSNTNSTPLQQLSSSPTNFQEDHTPETLTHTHTFPRARGQDITSRGNPPLSCVLGTKPTHTDLHRGRRSSQDNEDIHVRRRRRRRRPRGIPAVFAVKFNGGEEIYNPFNARPSGGQCTRAKSSAEVAVHQVLGSEPQSKPGPD